MVVEGLLVVIHVAGVRVEHEELAAEFEQVVGGAGFVLAAAGESIREQGVGLGSETLGIVRIPGARHAADAVHVTVGADVPEVVGDLVIGTLVRVPVGFQRAGDLRDVLVGVLAAEGVHVSARPWVWCASPKKKSMLSNSLAHSRKRLSPVRRDRRAMTSFMPPYSPAM